MIIGKILGLLGLTLLVAFPAWAEETNENNFDLAENDMETEGQDMMESMGDDEQTNLEGEENNELDSTDTRELSQTEDKLFCWHKRWVTRYKILYYHRHAYKNIVVCYKRWFKLYCHLKKHKYTYNVRPHWYKYRTYYCY